MGVLVTGGAMTMCTMGMAPGSLMTTPQNKVIGPGMPAANIMDNKPMVNILPFAMCKSPANPQVAAATAAALGVLTPMPCIPVPLTPWLPGSATVMVGTAPALNNSSKCMCQWAGTISITNPGQTAVMVP